MTNKEKLFEKLLMTPYSLHYRDMELILICLGFEMEWGRGSHKNFRHSDGIFITIPIHNGDCKKYYKNKVREIYINNFK